VWQYKPPLYLFRFYATLRGFVPIRVGIPTLLIHNGYVRISVAPVLFSPSSHQATSALPILGGLSLALTVALPF
jgi:hypothetical protein